MQKLILVLFILKFTPAFAWEIIFEGKNRPDEQQIIQIENFLDETLALMPNQAQAMLTDANLKIIFTKLSRHFGVPACSGVSPVEKPDEQKKKVKLRNVMYGQYNRITENVYVHSNFIEHILKGPDLATRFNCGHGNMYKQVQATLIHEWSHYLDDSQKLSSEFQFKRLAGFERSNHWIYYVTTLGLYKGPWRSKNELKSRSVNPYEFKNLHENFAVNFENYVLNPNYACHHPDYTKYFRATFGENKIENDKCSFSTQILFNSRNPQYDLKFKVDINPKRVAEIHYFFADEGDAMMSRWGHAMFRLIVCSPKRESVGPECRKDVSHHVVLSYRANVDDIVINSFKGLAGSYPSRLYLFPLPEVITEYTKEELRNVISLPIKMSEIEKENFILTTLRNYWSYEGSYKFIVNNCATEAAHLLDAGLAENHQLKSLSPLKLYKSLIKRNLIDTTLLQDKSEAIAQGFYFVSKKAEFEQALKLLAVDFNDWSKLKASERYQVVLDKIKSEQNKKNSLAAAAFVVESKIFFNTEKTIERGIVVNLHDKKKVPQDGELKASFDQARMSLIRPPQWTYLTSKGDGIPSPEEFEKLEALLKENKVEVEQNVQKILEDWLKTQFGSLIDELASIKIHKEYYRKLILEN